MNAFIHFVNINTSFIEIHQISIQNKTIALVKTTSQSRLKIFQEFPQR